MKTILFLIALTLSLLAMSLAPQPAFAGNDGDLAPRVMLKSNVMVDGDVIYLGDLFEGIGDKGNTVVAYAPQPGNRAVLDANWLARLAQAYRIDWRPQNHRVRAVVERHTIVVESAEIEDHLMSALVERGIVDGYGLDETMRLSLSNSLLRLHLPATSNGRIGVENIDYDPISGRLAAIITAPEGDPGAIRHRVTGRMEKMIHLPVMSERVLAGEVIDRDQIKLVWVSADKLQKDILVDADQLIGKSPKRGLMPGRPIRNAEVRDPILVPRGGLVTIVLKLANMTLTSQGKALENGSHGEIIRIVNTQSSKTIQAQVTGTGLVTVRAPAQELAENAAATSNLQW